MYTIVKNGSGKDHKLKFHLRWFGGIGKEWNEWSGMEGKGRDCQSCARLVGQSVPEDPPGFCHEWDRTKTF